MTSITKMEMATALSSDERISIKKSLFGLRQTAMYEPTHSNMEAFVNEYTPEQGERIERLLKMPIEKLNRELESNGKPQVAPLGNYRLEICMSQDHQFAAVQLFRYVDFKFVPITDLTYYEGYDVDIIAKFI